MHILFISSNRIGDAVLSTGLLSHLNDRYPDAHITVACGPVAAPLFDALPGLERLILLRKEKYNLHWLKLWCQTVFRKWDLVVDLRRSAIAYLLWATERRIQPKINGSLHRVELLNRSKEKMHA